VNAKDFHLTSWGYPSHGFIQFVVPSLNEGLIEFEGAEAGSRKGNVGLQAVLQTLIELR
jgi:hypothetical protein